MPKHLSWVVPALLALAGTAAAQSPEPVTIIRPAKPADTAVYRAGAGGHFLLKALVNGVPIDFVVDTGATEVALTMADARAVGLHPGNLVFDQVAHTANGDAREAAVRLHEIRLGGFATNDVPALVGPGLGSSLLGMSFLSRLRHFEMRDGKLVIGW